MRKISVALFAERPYDAVVFGMRVFSVALVEWNHASRGVGFPYSDPVSWLHVNPVTVLHVPCLYAQTRCHDLVLTHQIKAENKTTFAASESKLSKNEICKLTWISVVRLVKQG